MQTDKSRSIGARFVDEDFWCGVEHVKRENRRELGTALHSWRDGSTFQAT